jgi:NADH-quinone oxidoreductase subunit J
MTGSLIAGLVAAPILIILLGLLALGRISGAELVFYAAAAVILIGAIGAVTLSNVVHAAMALVATLLGVAAIYLLLLTEFIALVQVLVYGGGVVILLLFGLMLTNAASDPVVTDGSLKPFAFVLGAVRAACFVAAVLSAHWGAPTPVLIPFRVFGERIFRDFSVPVIIIAVLLDIAFTGAFVNARRAEAVPTTEADK